MVAVVQSDTADQIPSNDTARSHRLIRTGSTFAYETQPESAVNEIPLYTGMGSKGLCGPVEMPSNDDRTFWYAGQGTVPSQYVPNATWRWFMPGNVTDDVRYGPEAGGRNGAAAIRFTLLEPDTLRGYQAWWGGRQPGNVVQYSIVADDGGAVGTSVIPGSVLRRPSGDDDINGLNEPRFDALATVFLDNPVSLDSGTYWLVVEQLGMDGFHLGASGSRSAAVSTSYAESIESAIMATHVAIDHEFATASEYGAARRISRAAYRDAEGTWHLSMPTIGHWPYAHHNATGSVGYVMTWTQAGWIPLLRPYMEHRPRQVVSVGAEHADDDALRNPDDRQSAAERQQEMSGGTLQALQANLMVAPNPTSGTVHVRYSGRLDRLRVMNTQGIEVRRIECSGRQQSPEFAWDARDSAGRMVSNGSYLLVAEGSNGSVSATVMVIR
jgi:hypothetical protein